MGMMNKVKEQFHKMDKDSMKERFEQLKSKESSGDIKENERSELDKLRGYFDKR